MCIEAMTKGIKKFEHLNKACEGLFLIEHILLRPLLKTNYDAIVLAVSHNEFLSLNLDKLISATGVIFDVKSLYPKSNTDSRL